MNVGRTLVVTSTFPDDVADQRGAFVRNHWALRAGDGSAVTLLAPRTRDCNPTFDPGFELRRFRYAPRASSTLTGGFGIVANVRQQSLRAALIPPYFAALRGAIKRELASGRYTRVAAHFLLPSALTVARLCGSRIPFEVYGHGTDVDLLARLPRRARHHVGRWLAQAKAIYMPSEQKRRAALEAFAWHSISARVHVEHMLHTVAPTLRDQADHGPAGDYLLFLGRLIHQKGVDVLLEAMCEHPGQRLIVAGDGPCRPELEARAEALHVDAEFVGWVGAQRKAELLRHARALVVPSRTYRGLGEGAPLVIAEAHAMGRPVVASNTGGIPEIARALAADVTLVREDCPAALARALRVHVHRPDPSVAPANHQASNEETR